MNLPFNRHLAYDRSWPKVPVQEPRTSGVFFVPGMTGVGR